MTAEGQRGVGARGRGGRVLEGHAERRFGRGLREFLVDLRGLLERNDTVGQAAHGNPAGGYGLEEGAHVAVQGPAHVGQRVVDALLFVSRVVAAGAVGRAHEQVDFLPVEVRALRFEADVAHDDHPRSSPCHFHGEIEDGVGLGGGGDEHRVDTLTLGQVADQLPETFGVRASIGKAQRHRALHPVGGQIEAHHRASGGLQELRGQLADEAKTDDRDALAQFRSRPSHALEGDGPDRGGGSLHEVDALRDADHEVSGHAHELGVVGKARAAGRDLVPDREIFDSRTQAHDFAGHRVADVEADVVDVARGRGFGPVDGLRFDGFERGAARDLLGRDHHRERGRGVAGDDEGVVDGARPEFARAEPPHSALGERPDLKAPVRDLAAYPDAGDLALREGDFRGNHLVVAGRSARLDQETRAAGFELRGRGPCPCAYCGQRARGRLRGEFRERRLGSNRGVFGDLIRPLHGEPWIARCRLHVLRDELRLRLGARDRTLGRGKTRVGPEGGKFRPRADVRVVDPDQNASGGDRGDRDSGQKRPTTVQK